MPDLELVVAVAERPPEHHGIVVAFVDVVLQKHGPLVEFHLHLNTEFFQAVLRERGDVAADFVSVVGDEGEGKSLAVFLKDSVGSGLPACFGEELAGLFEIMGEGSDRGIEKPHLGREDAGALEAVPVKDVAHHRGHINGMSQGAADEGVLKKRTLQVPADVSVTARRAREDIEPWIAHKRRDRPRLGSPEIDLMRLEGQSKCELVGHEAVDDAVEPRARRIGGIRISLHAEEFIRAPLGEFEGPGADRSAVEMFHPPVLRFALEQVRGEEGNHPALERGRVGFAIDNSKSPLVGSFHSQDQIKVRLARRGGRVVHNRRISERRIARGERGTIVPAHIVAEREHHLGLGEKIHRVADRHAPAAIGGEP